MRICPSLAGLSPSLAVEVDTICDDFERFWRRARRRGEDLPDPERFALRVGENVRPLLRKLLEDLQRELLAEPRFPEVPGFTFLGEIARGPMGVVYRVRRDADARVLALKTIQSAELTLWSRTLRLLAEGEVLTQVQHPNIVPVEAFGDHEGLNYVVMPLIEGGDLRQRLGEFMLGEAGEDQLERITNLMEKVAGAVALLHQSGILHGDLKPSNILLTAPGPACEPLVCDFGLARRLSDFSAADSSELVGTLTYMAPEQMEGRSLLTAQADVWSLGAILYELLTGRPPFTEEHRLDTQRKVAYREPPPPCDTFLGRICRRCLQRDPAARYHSAVELTEDLLNA